MKVELFQESAVRDVSRTFDWWRQRPTCGTSGSSKYILLIGGVPNLPGHDSRLGSGADLMINPRLSYNSSHVIYGKIASD